MEYKNKTIENFYSNQFYQDHGIYSMEYSENNNWILINNCDKVQYKSCCNKIIIENLNIILYFYKKNYLYGWDKTNYYLFSNISMGYGDVYKILNEIFSNISIFYKNKIEDMITQYKIIINSREIRVINSVLSFGDLQQPKSRQGYYPTLYPSEMADLYRSHVVLDGGLPSNFNIN